jgi:hypothetical protein
MQFRLGLAAAANRVLYSHLLHQVAGGVGIWILLSAAVLLLLFITGVCYRIADRLKIAMIEAAGPLPPPLHDRRRRQRGRFRLRTTRRQLAPQEGKMLESLHRAIDYLVQTYNLKQFADQPQTTAPPQLAAVQILLQKRAEMLAEHPPMPSLLTLLRRRLAYLSLARKRA